MAFYCIELVLFRTADSVQVISIRCFKVWKTSHYEPCERLLLSAVSRLEGDRNTQIYSVKLLLAQGADMMQAS